MSSPNSADRTADDCYAWMSIGAYFFGLRPYLLHLQPAAPATLRRPATRGYRQHGARLSGAGLALYVFGAGGTVVALLLYNLTGYFGRPADRHLGLRSSTMSQLQSAFVRIANILMLFDLFARRLFGQRNARRQADLWHALDRRLAACERTAEERRRSARRLASNRWRWPLWIGMHVVMALMSATMWYFSVRAARSVPWMLVRVCLVIYPQLMRQMAVLSMAYQLGVLRHRMVWLNRVLERRLLVTGAGERRSNDESEVDDDEGD